MNYVLDQVGSQKLYNIQIKCWTFLFKLFVWTFLNVCAENIACRHSVLPRMFIIAIIARQDYHCTPRSLQTTTRKETTWTFSCYPLLSPQLFWNTLYKYAFWCTVVVLPCNYSYAKHSEEQSPYTQYFPQIDPIITIWLTPY